MACEGFLYFELGDGDAPNAVSELLFKTACWMRDRRIQLCVMSDDCCEVRVTTRFHRGDICGFWGMRFSATVTSGAEEQEIEFVISDSAQGDEKGIFASDDVPESDTSHERHDAYRWN